MKIFIGADYGAVDLKLQVIKYLELFGYEVIDVVKENMDISDYPEIGFLVGEAVRDNIDSYGIAICRSGHGVCIAANKVRGVRCIRATTKEEAFLGRDHDIANVLALGSEVTVDFDIVKEILDTFLNTPNTTLDRRIKRLEILRKYEEEN